MKPVIVTLVLPCRDDVPPHLVEGMAKDLADYAENAFRDNFDSGSWFDGYFPPFDGPNSPPLVGAVSVTLDDGTGPRGIPTIDNPDRPC